MTGRRDAVLAELDRLIAVAEVLTDKCGADEPWYTQEHMAELLAAHDTPQSDAEFIAEHSPSRMGAVWRGLREEVRRHARYQCGHLPGPEWCCAPCASHDRDRDAACPFVSRVAGWLGLGDGACPACGGTDWSDYDRGSQRVCRGCGHTQLVGAAPGGAATSHAGGRLDSAALLDGSYHVAAPQAPERSEPECGFPVDTEDDDVAPCRRPAGHPLFADDGVGCSGVPLCALCTDPRLPDTDYCFDHLAEWQEQFTAGTAALPARPAQEEDEVTCEPCQAPMRRLSNNPFHYGCASCGAIHLYADPVDTAMLDRAEAAFNDGVHHDLGLRASLERALRAVAPPAPPSVGDGGR